MFIRRLQKRVRNTPEGRRQRKVPNNIGKTPGRCQRQKKEIPLQLPLYPKKHWAKVSNPVIVFLPPNRPTDVDFPVKS